MEISESQQSDQTPKDEDQVTTQDKVVLQRKVITLHVYFMRGTVKAMKNFNPERECEKLKNAMRGGIIGSLLGVVGTSDKVLMEVLTSTSNEQRQEIVKTYKVIYGLDLLEEVESHTSFNFGTVCTGLLRTPRGFEAYCLRKALKGLGTNEDVLIEIICTCNNRQIEGLKEKYTTAYGSTLEDDVIGDTSGDFQTVLLALLQGDRSTEDADPIHAITDAKLLYDAGEGKGGADIPVFIDVFTSRSLKHLRLVFDEYEKLSGKTIVEAIRSVDSFYGNYFGKTLLTIVRVVQNKNLYFARRLQTSMEGIGTDDDTLIRVILRTCETVLSDVKDAFLKEVGETLESWIKGDTSGNYQEILLALIGERKTSDSSNNSSHIKTNGVSLENENK